MKTLIFDSNNQFSHRILVFSKTEFIEKFLSLTQSIETMFLFWQDIYPEIVIEMKDKKLANKKLNIRDFEKYSCTPILHKSSLFDLHQKHPWYFEEIKKTAEKENFIPSITYVCELIINYRKHPYFPKSTSVLKKEINEGRIKADYYEKFGEIEEIRNLFLYYFKLHLSVDSLICFWNLFVNSNSSFGNKIKKMLIDFKKNEERIISDEED